MSEKTQPAADVEHDATWAPVTAKIETKETPAGAFGVNMQGHDVMSPLQGFGQMWQRTYRVRLSGVQVTPAEVIQVWKANFARFQPPNNRFYAPAGGVKPGELVFIDTELVGTPGMRTLTPMASGVLVIFSDATSFTVMTPQGFPVSGWNTFSAYDDNGVTIAQVQGLERATDPIYEIGYRFMGGERKQDMTWSFVLRSLAAYFGIKGEVQTYKTCVDSRLQWSEAKNVWHNAALRTLVYNLGTPIRWLRGAPVLPPATSAPPIPIVRSQEVKMTDIHVDTPNPDVTPDQSPAPTAQEGTWAKPVDRLRVAGTPSEAVNLNVDGRQLTGPIKGFGQLWQKTYKVRLTGATVTPQTVIQTWKTNFQAFWPEGNRFYGSGSMDGIKAGDVAVLNLAGPAGTMISTGVLVIYADDVSFSYLTPEGHMFAGMITFSSDVEDDVTVAQIQVLVRASDPIYEMGCRIGLVHRTEDTFWLDTLRNLAKHFGVAGQPQMRTSLVDSRMQWSEAKNVWHNAAVRTTLYTPVRWVKRFGGGSKE